MTKDEADKLRCEAPVEVWVAKVTVATDGGKVTVEGLGDHAKEVANGGREVRTSGLAAFLKTRSSALIDTYRPGYEANEKRKKPIPHLYRARDAADHVLVRLE